MMSNDTLHLVRSGHEGIEMFVNQITPATVARVFSVSPSIVLCKLHSPPFFTLLRARTAAVVSRARQFVCVCVWGGGGGGGDRLACETTAAKWSLVLHASVKTVLGLVHYYLCQSTI